MSSDQQPAAAPEPASAEHRCNICGGLVTFDGTKPTVAMPPAGWLKPVLAEAAASEAALPAWAGGSEPASAADRAHAAGSLFSQFCAYGDDVPVGVGSALTVGDVRRAVRERYATSTGETAVPEARTVSPGAAEHIADAIVAAREDGQGETASDGAKGADGIAWQGELRDDGCLTRLREFDAPGCGLVQIAEDNAGGEWEACDDPHRVAVLVGTLLRDSLAREKALQQALINAATRITKDGRCWCQPGYGPERLGLIWPVNHEPICVAAREALATKEPAS